MHRIVLAWRAYDTVRFTGEEHALTLMRQALRFCNDFEVDRARRGEPTPPLRRLVPALIDDHGLAEKPAGTKKAEDAQVEAWAATFMRGGREEAARMTAEALAAGYDPEDLGQALSLAATDLVLCDPGRSRKASHGRYKGSVHGASLGVHAADSARAWRDVARVTGTRSAAGSLIAGAYHTAGRGRPGAGERAARRASRARSRASPRPSSSGSCARPPSEATRAWRASRSRRTARVAARPRR